MVNMFVLSDESGECLIIDASCYNPQEQKELDNFILGNKLRPVKLVNTHGHVDHVLGNMYVKKKYSIPIEIHEDDFPLFSQAKKQGLIFGIDVEVPLQADNYLFEGQDINFGNSTLKVIHVPGHSPGSVAFFSPEEKFVITGDTLFKGSIGRTDLPGGNYNQLIQSIVTKIMTLPQDTGVFPGHGPFTTIGEEATSNPFLV